MSKAQKKVSAQPLEGEKFHRIVAHPLQNGNQWRGYQIEEIIAAGSKVISRHLLGKADTKQQILAEMELLMVPDA